MTKNRAEVVPINFMNFKTFLSWIRNPGTSLSQRVFHGGVWVFALRIFDRGLMFIRTIILARLLAPSDFGLFGIAMLALSALQSLSNTGFNAALIQKSKNIEPYLDTAWTVQLIQGFFLAIILFVGAPFIGFFFEEPRGILLVRVLALSVLMGSFKNIGIVYFQKDLEFNKQFIYQLSGTVTDLIISISIALIMGNVWALIFGLLAGNFIRLIMSYKLHEYKPNIVFDWRQTKELLGFGRWILGSSILIFLINQGDDIFLGKLLGVSSLGLYQLAYSLSNMPATEITHVISLISFPAYSKLQYQGEKLKIAYLQVLQITTFLSVPIAFGFAFMSSDFVKLFLGEQWLPMVPAMRVLAFSGLIRSIGATTGPLFQAVGRPDLSTKLQGFKAILLLILIYPLTVRWGILGTSLAVMLNSIVVNPVADYHAIKTIRCRVAEFVRMIAVPTFGAIIMIICLSIIKYLTIQNVSILGFFILILIGILVYLGFILIIDKYSNYRIKSLIHQYLSTPNELDT